MNPGASPFIATCAWCFAWPQVFEDKKTHWDSLLVIQNMNKNANATAWSDWSSQAKHTKKVGTAGGTAESWADAAGGESSSSRRACKIMQTWNEALWDHWYRYASCCLLPPPKKYPIAQPLLI